jgi:hypothetical protein
MQEDGRLKSLVANQHLGTANGRAKLTESDVRQIRTLRASGVAITDLANEFGVSRRTIQSAAVGESWKHV